MDSFGQVTLLLVLALTVTTTVTANFNLERLHEKFVNVTKSQGNIFVQSLKYLHRGPPIEESTDRAISDDLWIEQKLDHFDASNTETWQMRYMKNDQYYEEGGPIFIFVGGEWAISAGSITKGHFVDMAAEHKGILYYTEHRYYGKSKPTSDITRENLKYLHVKQALADLAHFITYQRQDTPGLAKSKVIMAGGSYSATMVVWFKHLYPELLAGGWASSAPLLAKVDFKEYKEVCGSAILELGGQQCYNRVEKGIAELEAMIEQKRTAEVKAMIKLCNTFDETNDLDVWSLFSTISNLFAGIIQYQKGNDVPDLCNFLLKQNDDATAIAKFLLRYADSGCVDISYKDTLYYYIDSTYANEAKHSRLNSSTVLLCQHLSVAMSCITVLALIGRPWFYQTCNEYGWYQSSSSRKQPFGTKFPVTLETVLCEDVFGEDYTASKISARVAQTNEDFGGYSPNIENIYETHGSLDPWNAAGHTTEHGATILPLGSHCTDLKSISGADSAAMRASKERLAELVRQWLAD